MVARLPDSEVPRPSKISARGAKPSRRCLLRWLSIAPDEKMTRRHERSQRDGSASNAFSSGLAKASPTMHNRRMPLATTASRSSMASNEAPVSVTTVPPRLSTGRTNQHAAPLFPRYCRSSTPILLVQKPLAVRSRKLLKKAAPCASAASTFAG